MTGAPPEPAVLSPEFAALAVEAAAHWGEAAPPELIGERENIVFAVDLPAGRAALRLHRRGYQTEDAVRSELWWMEALAAAGVAVPPPLRTRDGELLARLSDGRLASALAWAPGVPLGSGGAPLAGTLDERTELHRRLGRLLAEVHVATDRLTLPPAFQRPHWDIEGLLGEAPRWGRFWENPCLTAEEAELLRAARADLRSRFADHAAAGADQGLVHSDALRENVLVDGTRLTLIDFDDSGFGFRLYDLGAALAQSAEDPDLPAYLAALVEGYVTLRPLDARDRALIPGFMLMRTLASVGWAVPRYAPDHPRHRLYIDRAAGIARRWLGGALDGL